MRHRQMKKLYKEERVIKNRRCHRNITLLKRKEMSKNIYVSIKPESHMCGRVWCKGSMQIFITE